VSTRPEDYYNLGLEKQRADNDRTHVSTTSIVWKPDYFRGNERAVRTALNGWTISGILTFQSGQPLAIITGTDDNKDGNANAFPPIIKVPDEKAITNRLVACRSEFVTTNPAGWI
jgi:hypothetical protein